MTARVLRRLPGIKFEVELKNFWLKKKKNNNNNSWGFHDLSEEQDNFFSLVSCLTLESSRVELVRAVVDWSSRAGDELGVLGEEGIGILVQFNLK